MNDLVFAIITSAFFSLWLFQCTGKNSIHFWKIFIYGSIFTSGFFVSEISIFDEIVLISGLITLLANRQSSYLPHDKLRLYNVHKITFNLLLSYLIFQSIRGVIIFEELRKLRWVVLFLAILYFSNLISKRNYLHLPRTYLSLTIAQSCSAYLLFYILFGVFAEYWLDISRFDLQQPGESTQMLWATTAYVLFVIVAAIPAICICLMNRDMKSKTWGGLCLFLTAFASIYYESRAGLVALTVSSIITLPEIGAKKSLLISFTILFPVFLACLYFGIIESEVFFGDLSKIWLTFSDPISAEMQSNEFDRYAHILVAYASLKESIFTLLFGHGFRVSGSVIGPYLIEVLSELSPDMILKMSNTDFSDVGTEALTAWLVDIGLVGFALLMYLHYIIIIRAWKSNNPARLSIIAAVCLCIFWLPIIDFRDITLYYLMLMPDGILSMLLDDRQKC